MTSKKFNPVAIAIFMILAAGMIFYALRSLQPDSGKNSSEEIASPTPEQTQIPVTTTVPPNQDNVPVSNETASDSQTQKQLQILEEILASHNDNDPRMDHDLMILGENTKAKFREKYKSLPVEKRNDRGTIVFLLGRNMTSAADFDFMKDVLSEPPCLSLSDCSTIEVGGDNKDHDEHQGSGFAMVLAYPQIVALHSLQGYLNNKSADAAMSDRARDLISDAKHSRVNEVSKMAESIESKLTH
ncbi:MAG TPA: hypothetical protein VF412_12335 [Bdellovibrio sp.]|uniref:hypothetical protein n=1 Tax=Bdellovibrio sp. TaxID=28201 RepID=UPI002F07ECEC